MTRAVPLLALLGLVAVARGAPPPAVPWRDAAAHVGEIVTVTGEVTAVQVSGESIALAFADEPRGFRVVLVRSLLGETPRDPERLYRGRRIRATGRVQRFQGRAEMVLRSPAQIEIEDDVAALEPPPPAVAPPAPPPAVAPLPPPRPVDRPLADAAPCERARARWREAAAETRARLTALARCLDAVASRCANERAALGAALAALDATEPQVEATCR